MADPGTALQKAIYDLLSAALSVTVYQHVPQTSSYPYVVVGDMYGQPADNFGAFLKNETFVTLSIWSQYRGQKEVTDIAASIKDALHNARPTLASGRLAQMRVHRSRTSQEPDGLTYMGQVTVRCLVEH